MRVAKAVNGEAPPATNREFSVEESYRCACPDQVEIVVAGYPECSGQFVIDADGRIEVPLLGRPRVEGDTIGGLSQRIANELRLPAEQVRCRVIDHRSREVFVHGEISGSDRAIAYRGPENVVSFIRRCGGLTRAANARDIHVVRGNVARGTKPQIFRVDLEAILMQGDPKTNVILQPFDEIYVGELPRAKFGRALPEWLRPVYRAYCRAFPAGYPCAGQQPGSPMAAPPLEP